MKRTQTCTLKGFYCFGKWFIRKVWIMGKIAYKEKGCSSAVEGFIQLRQGNGVFMGLRRTMGASDVNCHVMDVSVTSTSHDNFSGNIRGDFLRV